MHRLNISREPAALPDISRPMSKPSCIPEVFHRTSSDSRETLIARRCAHLFRKLQAIVVHVCDDDMARAYEARVATAMMPMVRRR